MPKKSENRKKKEKEIKKVKRISLVDFEKKVLELAEKGLSSEKIGEELRQQEIHPKEFRKKISKILKEKGKYFSPDLKNVEAKLDRIQKHFEKNKQDKRAKREKDRVFSQLRKIKKYLGIKIKRKRDK